VPAETARPRAALLALFGFAELVLLFAASRIRDPFAHLAVFLALSAGAFVACVLAAREAARETTGADACAPDGALRGAGARTATDRRALLFVLTAGALFRAIFLASPPALSSDVYRYVWDARAQAAGVNPFAHPPAAAEVAFLNDADASKINHPEISTIYPPLSQAAFRLGRAIAPGPLGMKIVFSFLDLCVALAAIVWLSPSPQRRLGAAVLLAWNPLSVIETAGSGHNDPLAILLLLAAIRAAGAARIGPGAARAASAAGLARAPNGGIALAAGALLGAAAAAKTLPLLLAPAFAVALGRSRALPFVAGLAAVLIASYAPFAGAGAALFRGLRAYALDLEFNASLFATLESILAHTFAPSLLRDRIPHLLPILPVLAAPILVRAARGDLSRVSFWTLGALVCVGSQVHPWYLLWVLPFAATRPSGFARAWLWFSILVLLSYATQAAFAASGVWRESAWVRIAQYAPLYGALLLDAARAFRGRSRAFRSARPASTG